MKWGIWWHMRISGVKRYIEDIYLMFLSREIDITLCQNYTKMFIYQILYKSCSIKQIIFNKYATNLKTTLSYRSLRISNLLLLNFNFYFALLIDILLILFLIVCTVRYYVTKTFANSSAVYWSCVSRDNAWDSQVSAYTPFHFSFTVPFETQKFICFYKSSKKGICAK